MNGHKGFVSRVVRRKGFNKHPKKTQTSTIFFTAFLGGEESDMNTTKNTISEAVIQKLINGARMRLGRSEWEGGFDRRAIEAVAQEAKAQGFVQLALESRQWRTGMCHVDGWLVPSFVKAPSCDDEGYELESWPSIEQMARAFLQ